MSPCSLALVFFSLFFDRVGGGGGGEEGMCKRRRITHKLNTVFMFSLWGIRRLLKSHEKIFISYNFNFVHPKDLPQLLCLSVYIGRLRNQRPISASLVPS